MIRLRNLPDARRTARRASGGAAVATVDWLAAQLPREAQYQIYVFNTRARALVRHRRRVAARRGRREAAQQGAARAAAARRREGGTSLEHAFAALRSMNPPPDNIILITDGLPTQGETPPATRKTIDGEGRLRSSTARSTGCREACPST